MQLDEETIKMIYDYFSPLFRVRGGDWITEMRRQIVVECREQDIKPGMIAKLIAVDHSSVSHYTNRMVPRPELMSVITDNKYDWMLNKKYPLTAYSGQKCVENYTYVLSDEPPLSNFRPLHIKAEKKNDKLNSFIESL